MHPYLILLCLACAISALSAGFVLGSRPDHRASQLAAALFAGAAYWTLCEILWNLAPDPAAALFLVRASAPGWCFIGPLVLQLFLASSPVPWPRMQRLLPALHAAGFGFVGLSWFSPWMFEGAERTAWGWAYVTGPVYPLFYLSVVTGVAPAVMGVARAFQVSYSPGERKQRPWILLGIGTPLLVGSVTDALLPALGLQVPRLASTSLAGLAAISAFSVRRYGYSFLTPTRFAEEVFETLSEGVALLQWDRRIHTANRGLARLSGHGQRELAGTPIARLLTPPPETGRGDEAVDAELIRADGAHIPVRVSFSTLRDRQARALGHVMVVRDLREVAELRQRLLLSARLAAVGELAAGIAHEINNPLAFVRANLNHLQDSWKRARGALREADPQLDDALAEGDELIEESIEGVNRAAEIVRGVRGFSHAGGGEREPSDLNRLLEEVLHMAETELRGRARVELDLEDLPPVICAPQELRQVFLNLVLNAGHAIQEGGTIRVETRCGREEVTVAVQDDGCGIEPEIIDRIFDPFFTTKKIGEGTGLGLGIAYQIVLSHQGRLGVESRPGHGARFEVSLPIRRDG